MPVFVDNSDSSILSDIESLKDSTTLKKFREDFLNTEHKYQVDVEKLMYIGQRELAIVRLNDKFIDYMGSADATTCHIVLIVDKGTKNSAMCHFDGSYTQQGIDEMIQTLKSCSDSSCFYDLYVIGGFNDEKKCSKKLTNELWKIFQSCKENFNLKLWCVTQFNNVTKNNIDYPIVYGICYNVKTQSLFVCNNFSYKGPDLGVRGARHFSDSRNMNIYDHEKSLLQIGPFTYESIDYVKQISEQADDKFLLKYFSTSPDQEPSDFCANLRASFQAMLNHPKPLETYFINNRPNLYKRVKGQIEWQRINTH